MSPGPGNGRSSNFQGSHGFEKRHALSPRPTAGAAFDNVRKERALAGAFSPRETNLTPLDSDRYTHNKQKDF